MRRRRLVVGIAAVAVAVALAVAAVFVGRAFSTPGPVSPASRPSTSTPSPVTTDSTTPPTASAAPTASAPKASEPSTPASAQPPRTVPEKAPPPAPVFDRDAHSTDDPTSIWVVSNKARGLDPIDYIPPDLVNPSLPNINGQPVRQVMVPALTELFAAAKRAGVPLTIQSAYRSYADQKIIHERDIAANGQAFADKNTARPGHSEHQTGLTVDLSAIPANCTLDPCFGDIPQGVWLVDNAWRYGFLLRYPADKVAVTGYSYEPWHFRYIGRELAAQMHREGVTTLEEFFDLPGGDYPDE